MLRKAILDAFLWLGLQSQGFSASTAETLVRLSRLETGHYESSAFKAHKNPWGMGSVQFRETTQVGSHANADAGIGHYASLWAAIVDMRLYFQHFGWSRKAIPDDFWRTYNPSTSYQESVMGVSHSLPVGLGLLAVAAPMTLLVITKILNRKR